MLLGENTGVMYIIGVRIEVLGFVVIELNISLGSLNPNFYFLIKGNCDTVIEITVIVVRKRRRKMPQK